MQCAHYFNNKMKDAHSPERGKLRKNIYIQNNHKKGIREKVLCDYLKKGHILSLCQMVPKYQWPLPPFSDPFIRW